MSHAWRGPLGRRAFDPSRPALRLTPHLTGQVGLAHPFADWLTSVGAFPMDGNADWGDCVIAAEAHQIQAWTRYAFGQAVILTEAQVLAEYSAVTGFNPDAGPPGANPTDQGTVMADALSHWRKTGLAGHTIVAYALVDHTNLDELRTAVDVFGSVSLGIRFPAYAMDAFNEGRAWDAPHAGDDPTIEGGHAVHLGAYDTLTGTWKLVTWGHVVTATDAFLDRFGDEAWVEITREWLDTAGHTPSGVDLQGLGADFAALTGQPNPFPAPAPPPPPGPPPLPTPPEPAPDALEAAVRALTTNPVVRGWVGEHHHAEARTVARLVQDVIRASGAK